MTADSGLQPDTDNLLDSPRRRRLLQAALATPLGPSLAACNSSSDSNGSSAVSYSTTIEDGRDAINKTMAATRTSSVSVALADGDRIIWQQAFGMVSQTSGQAAGVNTLYNIGSVSKVLAALAVMILVDRGQVDLDAPVTTYVRDFQMLSADYARVTVRMLLSHSSGFPGMNFNNVFSFQALSGYARKTQTVLAGQHLKHTPGELAVYCNDGFTMAERVVEEVSGKPYTTFVQQEILAPLDMTLSRYALQAYRSGTFAQAVYQGVEQGQEFVDAYGTGGLSSTPTEMMNLGLMFMNLGLYKGKRILSQAAVLEMGRNQSAGLPLNPSPAWKWGLGWDNADQLGMRAVGLRCWEKNGGTTFFGSDFFVLPEARLALMITGTSTAYGAARLAERILLHALVEKGQLTTIPAPLTLTATAAATASDAELDAIAGFYGSYEGITRVIKNGDRSLTVQLFSDGRWNTMASNLLKRQDGWFTADGSGKSYRLENIGPNQYLSTRAPGGYGHYWLYMPSGQRIAAAAAISAAWRGRLGKDWILVNEHESSTSLLVDTPKVTLTENTDLPGYVIIDGRQPLLPDSDLRTRQFMKIPILNGRELFELIVRPQGGDEWLQFSGYLYRPVSSLPPPITVGVHNVVLDADGNSEARKLTAATALTVTGARAWRLYDDQWKTLEFIEGAGTVPLPAGRDTFVMVYGTPTSAAQLVLT